MDKKTLFIELENALARGEISSADVTAFLSLRDGGSVEEKARFNIAHALYYVGGAIIFIGFAVFVGVKWESLSSALRILLTLGSGLAFYAAAVLLSRDVRLGYLPDALHFVGALLIPGGVFITLYEFNVSGNGFGAGFIFLAFAVMYTLSHIIFHRNLLLLFAVIFGLMSYLIITDAMVASSPVFEAGRYAAYRILAAGLAFVLLGKAWSVGLRRVLSGVLFGFGTLGFLGAALALGEWKPTEIVPKLWEIVYPAFSFGAMFLALRLNSRSMLVFGALFTVGYIGKITGEYFAESTGWPLALILIGFALIGVGYLTIFLGRKFMKTPPMNTSST